jgi:WD40 repeat protein
LKNSFLLAIDYVTRDHQTPFFCFFAQPDEPSLASRTWVQKEINISSALQINMNLSLVDPFVLAQDYPESVTGSLRSGHTTVIRFNRKGDFLAAGRADGIVVIFDVETNGVARKLKGHTRQIASLSWSRGGRYLLTSSQDWKCNIWDLQDGSIIRSVRFEAPVYLADMHPLDQ